MKKEFGNGLVGHFCLGDLSGVVVKCQWEPFESLTVLGDLFPK